jgi:inward rectifier potassium channel
MFSLSWTLFHVIDETSHLYGLTPDDLAAMEGAFALNLSGVDDNSAQPLYARRLYSHRDIRWNYRYRDITSLSSEGRLLLDYSLFHEVMPEPESATNQGTLEDAVASEEALSEP